MTRPLSRRTVLRGASVSLALPVLDAMFDRRGWLRGEAQAAPGGPPVRLVFFFFPDGIQGARGDRSMSLGGWTPAEEGAGYTLTTNLKALAPVKDDVNVVSFLRQTAFYASMSDNSCCHCKGMPSVLTGAPSNVGGTSVDVVAAKELGTSTKIGSLCIGAHSGGFGAATTKTSSYVAKGQANPPMLDPMAIFSRLFGAGGLPSGASAGAMTAAAPVDPAVKYRKSVLDQVKADIARLQGVLGAADRVRLDAHLAAVRDLERELGFGDAAGATAPRPVAATAGCKVPDGNPGADFPAKLEMLMRLTTMALACDLTRFVVLQMSQAGSYLKFPWLGINYQNHDVSHEDNGGTPNARANYTTITNWKVEQFAKLTAMLKGVSEGDGTLLDNSLMLFYSDCGVGTGHSCHSMPTLLAGRGGRQVRTGRHVKAPSGAPYNRLLLALLKYAGSSATRFGIDGTEPLGGLS